MDVRACNVCGQDRWYSVKEVIKPGIGESILVMLHGKDLYPSFKVAIWDGEIFYLLGNTKLDIMNRVVKWTSLPSMQ